MVGHSEEFPVDVPSRAEEITIPGDLTPEKVNAIFLKILSKEHFFTLSYGTHKEKKITI
jgi:hypothetical protein